MASLNAWHSAVSSLRPPRCRPTAPSPSQTSTRATASHCPRSCRHPQNRSSAFSGRREVGRGPQDLMHAVHGGLRERLGRHAVGPDQVAEVRSGEHRVVRPRGLSGRGARGGRTGRSRRRGRCAARRSPAAGAFARRAPVPTRNDGEDGSARAASATSRASRIAFDSPCPVIGSVRPAASPTSTAPGASGRSVQASFIGYDTPAPPGARGHGRAQRAGQVTVVAGREHRTGPSRYCAVG